MITTKDIAWLAGIFEGEGCIVIDKRKYLRPSLAVAMSDEDVIRRCHTVAGVGYINGPYQTKGKPVWRWGVGRQVDVIGLLMTLYPMLGERRQSKAREAIAVWKLPRPHHGRHNLTHCPRGHKFTPENTYTSPKSHQRMCQICRHAYLVKRGLNPSWLPPKMHV